MIKRLLYIVFFLLSGSVFAQQLPLYSQYNFNRFGFNPAYAGNKNRVEAVFTHRNHLMNFPGAPTSQLVTVSAPWQEKYLGLGLRVQNDNIGVMNHFSFNLAGNYFIGLGEGKLAMGLEIGFDQYTADWASLVIYDAGDLVIPVGKSSIYTPEGAFGMFYTTENWYAGYSVQHLISSRLSFQGPEVDNVAHKSAHHYINVGGLKKINDDFQIEPFVLIKAVSGAPWQMDLGSYVVLKNKYGAGLTFRTGDAIVFSGKIELFEQFYMGYSFETRINSLASYSSSSHEIMLGYYYKLLEPARKKAIHPRYYF